MNNICNISVMTSDDAFLVNNLRKELLSSYTTVQLIALGTADDVQFLQQRYKDILSLEQIKFDFESDKLFLLSLDAYYELHSYLNKFAQITFWFDPEFSFTKEQPVFLTSITVTNLARNANPAICARSEYGQERWMKTASIDAPLVSPNFDIFSEQSNIEPLIEKKGVPRILIDGGSSISNCALIEAFIAIEQNPIDSETWCLFNGELKPWMKPDFQISDIIRNQLPIYVESIDGIVITGSDNVQEQKITSYLSLGKMPIVISHEMESAIESLISTDAVKRDFPSFGSVDLLHELMEDREILERYNALSKTALLPDAYFNIDNFNGVCVASEKLKNYVSSSEAVHAKEEYLLLKYRSADGSSLHKKLKQDSQIVAEYNSELVNMGRFSGWTLDTASHSTRKPIVLNSNGILPLSVRRYDRLDVTEHFSVQDIKNVGFEGYYVLLDKLQSTEAIYYAIEGSGNTCFNIHTMVEDLNVHYDAEEFSRSGYSIESSESVQGCVETTSFTNAALFVLSGLVGDISECEFRIKMTSDYLTAKSINVYVFSNEELIQLASSTGDDYSFSLADYGDQLQNIKLVVTGEDISASDIQCVVSCSSSTVTYSPDTDTENDAKDASGPLMHEDETSEYDSEPLVHEDDASEYESGPVLHEDEASEIDDSPQAVNESSQNPSRDNNIDGNDIRQVA